MPRSKTWYSWPASHVYRSVDNATKGNEISDLLIAEYFEVAPLGSLRHLDRGQETCLERQLNLSPEKESMSGKKFKEIGYTSWHKSSEVEWRRVGNKVNISVTNLLFTNGEQEVNCHHLDLVYNHVTRNGVVSVSCLLVSSCVDFSDIPRICFPILFQAVN